MSREAILSDLCDRILALAPGRPAAVAVDGADAAGKSTFADALVAPLETRGAVVVRASVDDFERPRAERHARGRFSAKGYYRNSFDY
ncbi:MAG: uridine kinase, partial [Rhodospirillaceae bacterium]|nr:uridine kinase [Rhodospirillaceae bacterium]